MTTYERITYRDGGKVRSVMLQDVAETKVGSVVMLTGVQVDRSGDLVAPSRAYLAAHGATDGTIRHVIEAALVTRREPFEMDLHYATLVPLGTAKLSVARLRTEG